MAYTDEITRRLISVIDYASGLPVHKLIGYARNLNFWIAETRHCLDTIDGYESRYQEMCRAERSYYDEHKDDWQKRRRMGQSPQVQMRSIKAHELKELRRALLSAINRLISRCFHEGFVDAEDLQQIESILGVDFRSIAKNTE